ncbi:trigger factor family protein, partial [bacterium]|nr:trigger factor family protein [bacterium]
MAISIEHLSNTKKECIVTYSSQEFKQKYKNKFKAFKPKARINGFRPGQISDSVIEKKFGLSLKQEVVDEMLQS